MAIPPNLKRIGYPCHIYMIYKIKIKDKKTGEEDFKDLKDIGLKVEVK